MAIDDNEVFDVFLSHSHIDSDFIEKLAIKLVDNASLKVWLDKWVLIPGKHWQQEMAMGLHKAKSCAVCIGEKTPSGWFKEEIERALNRQTKDNSFRVIPVLLPQAEKINVDDFIELRTWVDFKNGITDDDAFRILLAGIRGMPPGRFIKESCNSLHIQVRERLAQIQILRNDRLIDDDIAKEYQRRLMDTLIKL